MLYRVFFNASNASYARCFTNKEEAEKFYYEFSINVVKTLSPNIESENAALAKLNGWKAVIESIALHM